MCCAHLVCLIAHLVSVKIASPPGNVSWRDCGLDLSRFSSDSEGSAVVDLTMLHPKKRKLTHYFAPVVTKKVESL